MCYWLSEALRWRTLNIYTRAVALEIMKTLLKNKRSYRERLQISNAEESERNTDNGDEPKEADIDEDGNGGEGGDKERNGDEDGNGGEGGEEGDEEGNSDKEGNEKRNSDEVGLGMRKGTTRKEMSHSMTSMRTLTWPQKNWQWKGTATGKGMVVRKGTDTDREMMMIGKGMVAI